MSSPAPAEIAKSAVKLILGGTAVMLCVVALVYILMVILDRYCSRVLEPAAFDHGPVARKAGLWGLLQDERRVILERILIEKPYKTDMLETQTQDSDDSETDVENPPTKDAELLANDKQTRDDEPKDEISPDEKATDVTLSANMEELNDAQNDNTCAICLSDFVVGNMVVSGTSCSHIFHKTCAFEWLDKHDHCPYCRKEMMTASEMRSTAHVVLGEQRFSQMRKLGPTIESARNDVDDNSTRQVNATPAT